MSKRGLPISLKMRHDAHYVEALASSAGSPIGRMVAIELIDPNPDQPRQVMGDLSELKASIADLTDDADRDGLSDKWEIANFGSITLYDGNSDPDADGVKNSLELSAGTKPMLADSDGDGINDYAEFQAGSDPMNANDQPGFVVQIYNAAEIEFASQVGKKYQVQKVSDLTSAWVNVGSVTNGTGNNISMVTSARGGNGQAYFRVVQVP